MDFKTLGRYDLLGSLLKNPNKIIESLCIFNKIPLILI